MAPLFHVCCIEISSWIDKTDSEIHILDEHKQWNNNTNTYKSRYPAYEVQSHRLQTYTMKLTVKAIQQYSSLYHSNYFHRSLMLMKKKINATTFKTTTKKPYIWCRNKWSLSWQTSICDWICLSENMEISFNNWQEKH